ncbi:DUF7683 domain-containing protein [Nafulsella turpanensis]|uniref:DUF7683 domain-containing protein n=1 Tax=Nafulsella turpanensis TaxID=1265690 RepID=UPI00037C80C2|nr:hypothetical protein [Nafulsella turpanensis]
MRVQLDSYSIEEIAKLRQSTGLADRQLARMFGISESKIKKDCNLPLVTTTDFVLGALMTNPVSTVSEIVAFVDFKNKVGLTDKEIKETLKMLQKKGLAFKVNETWSWSERLVETFDNKTEKLVAELTLARFDLNQMKTAFAPAIEGDPLMYNMYEINNENYELVDGLCEISFDFDSYSYYLACRQNKNVT